MPSENVTRNAHGVRNVVFLSFLLFSLFPFLEKLGEDNEKEIGIV
jgi:hypothetical protein